MVFSAFAQFTLKGIVTGNGEKLAGASVVVENTFYGTSTKADGSFIFSIRTGTKPNKIQIEKK